MALNEGQSGSATGTRRKSARRRKKGWSDRAKPRQRPRGHGRGARRSSTIFGRAPAAWRRPSGACWDDSSRSSVHFHSHQELNSYAFGEVTTVIYKAWPNGDGLGTARFAILVKSSRRSWFPFSCLSQLNLRDLGTDRLLGFLSCQTPKVRSLAGVSRALLCMELKPCSLHVTLLR